MIGSIQLDVPVRRETNLLAKTDSLRHELISIPPRGCPEESVFNRGSLSLFLLYSYLGDILTEYFKEDRIHKIVLFTG